MRKVLLAIVTASAVATAELPDKAPPESREQVATALRALRPVLPATRSTLETAILAYAPGRFHPVDEGTLPVVHTTPQGASCPTGMADVAHRFCIDKWEGSLVERHADGTEAPWSPFQAPESGHVYVAHTSAGVIPQAYISAAQADKACKAAGKRLCAPVEWRAACGGSQSNAFPYGAARVARKCHDTGVAPAVALHVSDLNDPRLNQMQDTIAKTGEFADCVNDYGVYDMVGNVHEWTSDPNGTFQGGYWLDTSLHGDGCAYRTIAHDFTYHDYSTGFRCCADP
jgi:formylglycine-generating enzyme required for sulfatase activity